MLFLMCLPRDETFIKSPRHQKIRARLSPARKFVMFLTNGSCDEETLEYKKGNTASNY